MEFIQSNKIIFVVTDNVANIKKAINNLNWKHYGCYGYTLNLIVQRAITGQETLQETLEKVNKTLRFLRVVSSTALEKILMAQTSDQPNCVPKRLVQEVPTRWNSRFHVIKCFVELEQYIRSTVAVLR